MKVIQNIGREGKVLTDLRLTVKGTQDNGKPINCVINIDLRTGIGVEFSGGKEKDFAYNFQPGDSVSIRDTQDFEVTLDLIDRNAQ